MHTGCCVIRLLLKRLPLLGYWRGGLVVTLTVTEICSLLSFLLLTLCDFLALCVFLSLSLSLLSVCLSVCLSLSLSLSLSIYLSIYLSLSLSLHSLHPTIISHDPTLKTVAWLQSFSLSIVEPFHLKSMHQSLACFIISLKTFHFSLSYLLCKNDFAVCLPLFPFISFTSDNCFLLSVYPSSCPTFTFAH